MMFYWWLLIAAVILIVLAASGLNWLLRHRKRHQTEQPTTAAQNTCPNSPAKRLDEPACHQDLYQPNYRNTQPNISISILPPPLTPVQSSSVAVPFMTSPACRPLQDSSTLYMPSRSQFPGGAYTPQQYASAFTPNQKLPPLQARGSNPFLQSSSSQRSRMSDDRLCGNRLVPVASLPWSNTSDQSHPDVNAIIIPAEHSPPRQRPGPKLVATDPPQALQHSYLLQTSIHPSNQTPRGPIFHSSGSICEATQASYES